jgi:hypothetical protein
MTIEAIDYVFKLSEDIVNQANHVTLNEAKIKEFAEFMKSEPMKEKQVDKHKIKVENYTENEKKCIILNELVADSINYCYWQYNSRIRPFGAGSTRMREILDTFFDAEHAFVNDINFEYQIRQFIKALQRNRFPMMKERIENLDALCIPYIMRGASTYMSAYAYANVAITFTKMVVSGEYSFPFLFDFLITEIDGYGDDPFLKRACLFFLQLNRILGMFEEWVKDFPVPADYQVPKLMHYHGLFDYSPKLTTMIDNGNHLEENGPMEMEIRAATVHTGKLLCDEIGWPASNVDGWFFTRRNECQDPFHLCKTSNY